MVGKVTCWGTKVAISLKRVKIEEKLLWRTYSLETHQHSFERYHYRPPTASSSPRLGVRNPHPKYQSLFSEERLKLRTSNFVRTFIGSNRNKIPLHISGKVAVAELTPNFSFSVTNLRSAVFLCTQTFCLILPYCCTTPFFYIFPC